MRLIRRRTGSVGAVVALIGLLLWAWLPVGAIRAIANLSDPAKLATLGERGANARLNRILYWLDEGRRRGFDPATVASLALRLGGTREPRFSLVRDGLLRNVRIADELGLLTPENREHLRRGRAAIVTRGPYAGEAAEIDHIVPRSLAPELDNELANLELLPQPLNRRKSDRVGPRQLAHAEKLRAAGLLTEESYARVRAVAAGP
ncbi:MAG TPA: hypothetical protein VNO52_15715 [Methylomirabilota bacterium]|nr:hypothetical protein [Methylomirabilota bacterium]